MSSPVKVAVLVALFASGCSSNLFGRGPYDAQSCVEESLRRNPKNPEAREAAAVFAEACKLGDAAACSVHGLMLELGAGVPSDAPQARALYAKACSAQNQRACANLSRLELQTATDVVDIAQAQNRLLIACEEGEASACAFAGSLSSSTQDRDPETTAALLTKACNRGQTSACYDLAEATRTGAPPSVAEIELYVKACLGGHEPACKKLAPTRVTVAASPVGMQ
jgi:TPR repeat protein